MSHSKRLTNSTHADLKKSKSEWLSSESAIAFAEWKTSPLHDRYLTDGFKSLLGQDFSYAHTIAKVVI